MPCLCSCNSLQLPINACGVPPRGWQNQSPVRLVTAGTRACDSRPGWGSLSYFLELRWRELPRFFSPIFSCPKEVLCKRIHCLDHWHDSIVQQLLWHGMHFTSVSLIDLLHWESRVFYQHSLNITKSFFFINLLLIISEIFLLLNLFLACIRNDSFQRLSQNIKILNIKCSSYWFSWSCSWLYGFHSSDFSLSIYIHRFSLA